MSKKPSTVEQLTTELDANRKRAAELEERAADLLKVAEAGRDALGRSMALGESEEDMATIRERTRRAEDDREATARAIEYLDREAERLKGELRDANAVEAVARRDRLVPEANTAVDELVDRIDRWLLEFVPAVAKVEQATEAAFEAERTAAKVNGERPPHHSRVLDEGWGSHPGAYGLVTLLKKYGDSPEDFGRWYYHLMQPPRERETA